MTAIAAMLPMFSEVPQAFGPVSPLNFAIVPRLAGQRVCLKMTVFRLYRTYLE
jgi:hypothetical protein